MPRRGGQVATRRHEAVDARRSATGGRVHLYVGISLDGYLAAPDGGVDWLNPYADARQGFTPFIRTIGSTILGRATYDHAVAGGYADFGMPAYVVTHRPLQPSSSSTVAYSASRRDSPARSTGGRRSNAEWSVKDGPGTMNPERTENEEPRTTNRRGSDRSGQLLGFSGSGAVA